MFCPDDTPVYPGFHNLWSRDWVSDELDDVELGEVPDARRRYSLGAAGGPVPPPGLVGDPDCIELGERWPLPVVTPLVGGFVRDCFAGAVTQQPNISVSDPNNWCFWAGILVRTYTDAAGARAQVAAVLGVADTGWVQGTPQGIMPANFGLTTAGTQPIVIVLAGTDNTVQWVSQVFFGVGPPRTFNRFNTNPVWYEDCDRVLALLLNSGASATQDVVIVGHSLGAAIACVLAARLRLQSPDRRIQLLTIGCPRPGDQRLYRILRTLDIVTLQNEGDIVTAIPSNFTDFPPQFRNIVRVAYPPGAPEWSTAPNRKRVAWDGTVSDGPADPGLDEALNRIWLWSIGQGPFPDLSQHLQAEYERRLCAPAPGPVVWLEAGDVARVDGDPVSAWPNRVDAFNSPEVTPSFVTAPKFRSAMCGLGPVVAFRCTPGMRLPAPVARGTDFTIYAVVAVHRELGDGLPAFLVSPIGNPGGGAGVSWGATSATAGTWAFHGLGTPVLLPDGGAECLALLLSVSLCGGTLSARLESGTDIIEGVQLSVPPDPSGLFALGEALFVSSADPNPTFLLAELLVYDRCLSADDGQSVLDYLRLKWLVRGLGITTEGGDPLTTEGGDPLITE